MSDRAHLERVSRSFAFCIAELRPPLRAWVGLSYLLCRIADGIEDGRWSSKNAQDESYRRFMALVEGPAPAVLVAEFRAGVDCELPPGESRLLDDAGSLLADLHAPPPELAVTPPVEAPAWFRDSYRGKMGPAGFHNLNLFMEAK